MLFRSPASDPGLLGIDEIAALDLPKTDLVVLSACNAAAGEPWGSEGVASIASAFIRAGVPAVVASLWEVEDEGSAIMLASFYEELRRGVDPLSALRNAQVRAVQARDPATRHPGRWAAFQLIGGISPKR